MTRRSTAPISGKVASTASERSFARFMHHTPTEVPFLSSEVASPSAPLQKMQPKFSLPRRANMKVPRDIFLPAQEWEGYVTFVEDQKFGAMIYRLPFNKNERAEIMQFDFSDETLGDKSLIVPGAIFRWLIGYQMSRGVKSRQSQVIFRRLPAYTKQDEAAAQISAKKLEAIFKANQ